MHRRVAMAVSRIFIVVFLWSEAAVVVRANASTLASNRPLIHRGNSSPSSAPVGGTLEMFAAVLVAKSRGSI